MHAGLYSLFMGLASVILQSETQKADRRYSPNQIPTANNEAEDDQPADDHPADDEEAEVAHKIWDGRLRPNPRRKTFT